MSLFVFYFVFAVFIPLTEMFFKDGKVFEILCVCQPDAVLVLSKVEQPKLYESEKKIPQGGKGVCNLAMNMWYQSSQMQFWILHQIQKNIFPYDSYLNGNLTIHKQ